MSENNVENLQKQNTSTAKTAARKKRTTKSSDTSKEESSPSQVAIYSQGKLFDPVMGRLAKGYNVVSLEEAQKWMNISNKVRIATPEEVAMAYGA